MKKKIFSLILALVLIVGSIPLNLLSVAAEQIDKLAADDENPSPPIVSIEPVDKHNKTDEYGGVIAKPDASGYAHFIIKAEGEFTDDITVYYATEDLSAIAAAGDYEAKSGSVVLTEANPEVQISVKTEKSEYSIDTTPDYSYSSKDGYVFMSRSFKVKLTGVSANAEINKDAKEVKCSLNADHWLDAVKYDGATVLRPFTYHGKYEIYNFLTSPTTCGSDETVSKTVALNFPAYWAADYIDGGIDAKLYLSLKDAHVDESWWNSSSGITVNFLDNVTIKIKGEFHDNEEFGWGPAFLYVKNGVENGQDGVEDKYKDYYNENYESVEWDYFWGDWDLKKAGLIYNLTTSLNSKIVIRRRYSFGEPNEKSNDPGEYYIGLADGVLKKTSTVVSLTSHGGYSRKLTSGTASFRLEDIIAPKIEQTTSGEYAIYHNFDTATKNDKLRIAIRFSEPVQVRGRTPFFVGKINGRGTGVEPNPYAIRFTYVGGSGTDTLYFEADYSGEYQINSITDIQFRYADSITDFGGVANSFSAPSNIVIDGFNIDRRNPTISVSARDSHMTHWGKSKSVAVTVSNISEGTVLQYAWTDSSISTNSLENQVTLNNVSVNGTQTVNIYGDGDGSKFLHLKVVTKYGREQTQISIVDETVKYQNYLGPYNFDNTPPVADESMFLPIDTESNMSVKKYSIPVPRDVGSKNIELKMYYVDESGETHCLENKTYTFTEKDTKPHSIELTAEDVGIESGEDGRRKITVFFTLSDEIGNIDSDFARHDLLFDTREYIIVGHAGATSEFAEMTDTLNEGYTLVYNGDVQTQIGEVCFGFEFKGINDLSDELIYLFLYKNGEPWLDADIEVIEDIDHQAGKLIGYTIKFKGSLDAGYYDIHLGTFDGGVTEEEKLAGRLPDHVSETWRFYVGTGKGNLDEQINKGTMLINKVYQLPALSYFYYMDNNGTIGTVKKEFYNGTSLSASFSSKSKALEYVLFNEYRDLYAITLTAELAEALNAGNSNVQKALGEETIAREGQVWIRYKSASWSVGKAPDSANWVFYYYGTSKNLDLAHFSPNLINALNSVASGIVAQGSTVALTDISIKNGGTGASLVDKLGVPYLAPLQIHDANKRLADETLNSRFLTEITFTADSSIYSSSVIINAVEYNLLGNVVIPEEIRLQYKRIDESGIEDKVWTEIVYTKGQRFGDVIAESGRYKIRELGADGVSVVNAYIDKDAPMVLISWRDKDGASNSQIINKSSEKDFRGKTLRIVGIDSREYDKYSYVALYKASDSSLYGVYTLTELQKSAVDVDNGNYYMVIADRSGNSYVMTLNINSSNLAPDVKINENVKIKFTCDRKESQIQEFYVKRNGVLVSGKYAPELEFTESGTYEFYVRDIYGNVYNPDPFVFNRVYPEVSWKYRDESGYFVAYDSNNKTKYFSLDSTVDGIFTLSTSVNLKFQISGDYGYTFMGIAPEYEENIRDSTVTIKTTQTFQLKVYYKKHPEVYTIYNCSADTVAPVIEASVQIDSYMPNELEELRQVIAAGNSSTAGSKLMPSKISYSLIDTQTRYLSNNDIVLSDYIKVNVYDESGLAYVYIYLNGVLIKELDSDSASSGIILSKSGTYLIVAEDALGNKSEFNYTNGTLNSFSYAVDGLPMKIGLRDHENFDENGNYTDSTFGNSSVAYYIYEPMKIFYMITDSKGAKHFVAFDVSNKTVRELYYCADSENNLALETSDKVLIDGNNPKTVVDKEYVIYEIKEMGLKIFGRISANGVVTLSIYVDEGREFTVETRLNTNNEEFYYTKTELSSLYADLMLETSEGVLRIKETNELIKINRTFAVSRSNFLSEKVSLVEVYYSTTNNFDDLGFFLMDDIYVDGRYYEEEGFYYVRLVNQYGNESTFVIHVSYRFDVTSYSEFADGQKTYYSAKYTDTIYSNNKIVFEVYSTAVVINVKKDGSDYQPVVNIENGITYVILSDSGRYTVSLSDSYANTIERSAEIDASNKEFNESLLTGYNENALKKNEGYTNQKLSINKNVIETDKICYLAVQYGETLDLIYDCISENGTDLDESKLTDIIGQYGDGEYILIARTRYGAILTKVIHYRGTPTLILEREIRSSTEPEPYALEKALSVGFWSNSELFFRTEAEYYEFTINKDRTECPKTLSFASADQQGYSEYEITYVDEYGFSYSFKAYLVRDDLEIKPDIGDLGQQVDGILTTSQDVSVIFSENAYCTYTLNNSEERIYTPGEKLSMDGVYRFIAVDHAGNMSALTIKKDTIVEFAFIESNTSTELQSGVVVNNSAVVFKALNSDSAYIEKAFKNGIQQNIADSTKFTEDGKWELIVSDKLGNRSYFCFYIITKQKSSFAYTTPYEYHVTELWYDSGDGVKISYVKFVNQGENTSSFEFVENGKYTVVMMSDVTGRVSQFEFTINTAAPEVSLVGCAPGDTTINDITLSGCIVGDKIKVYKATSTGEKLVNEIDVTSLSTKMPTINEGGEYRIVVESEAGVATELSFVRKHVMNTEGSIFIMIVIGAAVIGLFTGLIYRNKSKTDK